MKDNSKHSDLSYALVNTFETALWDRATIHWDDLCVSSPIYGHPNYGIVVQGEKRGGREKGFSISLRQNFSEKTLGQGNELLNVFAPLDRAYGGLLNSLNKTLNYFEQSMKPRAVPIHAGGPYGVYTKETMQPLLDALNAGDFKLATELTPSNLRLCGYQEFAEEHLHSQYGHGWAGQFEDTVIAPGRYPVFASQYEYLERNGMYSNRLKDFQGISIFLAGKCIADSIDRAPEDYPYDNTVFESPYCHAVASAILNEKSSIHLLPPFKAEPVHFEYNGEACTTYKIVDESLPEQIKQNPMTLRNTSSYIYKTAGLSEEARKLYDRFIREYSYSLRFHDSFINHDTLTQDKNYSEETLNELLTGNKIQLKDIEGKAYELTVSERLNLFHSGQIHCSELEPLKWRAEYQRCCREAEKKNSLSSKIEAAHNVSSKQKPPLSITEKHLNSQR